MSLNSPKVPAAARSAMGALKAATSDLHRRLERRLAGAQRFHELSSYIQHISQLAAFHTAAEAAWGPQLSAVLRDFPARRKADLLICDVNALGGAVGEWPAVPHFTTTYASLGGFYVLEGASLGGQILLPLVERQLGLSAAFGAAYLASYGSNVGQMWTSFGNAVDAHCADPVALDLAVEAARATFLALEVWLCGEPV